MPIKLKYKSCDKQNQWFYYNQLISISQKQFLKMMAYQGLKVSMCFFPVFFLPSFLLARAAV